MSYELNNINLANREYIIDMNDTINDETVSICCICLDTFKNCEINFEIKLNCCKNPIHNHCLIELFVKNYQKCPLCRQNVDINNYFNERTFQEHINYFPNSYKSKNNYQITKILYKLENTKYIICGYKFKSIKRTLYLFILNIFKYKNYQNLLLLLLIWSISYTLVRVTYYLESSYNTNTEHD